MQSLTDVLKESFGQNKGITFVNSSQESSFLPYELLYERARYILFNLRQKGIKEGDEVIIQVEDSETFVLLFWACILGKIVPVPLSLGNNSDQKLKLVKVWKKLNTPHIITDSLHLKRLQSFVSEEVNDKTYDEIIDTVLLVDPLTNCVSQSEESTTFRNELAYIQFSSGSTGSPKGVMLTHSNLITNISDIAMRTEMSEDDTSLSWVPLTHDMGLICFHLTSVFAKINQYILPTSLFIRHPLLWIDKASENGVSILYSPNFGYQYFLSAYRDQQVDWDLSSVRIIFNGAEIISEELCQRFLSTMTPFGLREQAMCPGYGLAEASVAVCLPDPSDVLHSCTVDRRRLNVGEEITYLDQNDRRGLRLTSVGFPIANCSLRICNQEDIACAENVLGHIQIKGGNVTAGYYNDEEKTPQVFTADGWLKTGDLGFMNNGQLTIAGRLKNIIIVNGQNYYPHDIERAVGTINGITTEKVVACSARKEGAFSDQLIVFLLFKGKTGKFIPLIAQVKKTIMEAFGIIVEHVIPIRKIPKTTSGKVQNFQLAKEYERGNFDNLNDEIDRLLDKGSPNERSKADMLRNLVENFLGIQDLAIGESFSSIGLQSIQAVHLAEQIKRLFKVEVSLVDILNNPTVEKLIRRIEELPTEVLNIPGSSPINNHYHTTYEQKRFWLLHQYFKHKSACNIAVAYRLTGPLDSSALEQSFQSLVSCHESLRTIFTSVDGQPKQIVLDRVSFKLTNYSLGIWDDKQVKDILNTEARQEFELDRAPLFRVVLVSVSEQDHVLMVVMHHIISDGWSLGVLFDQVNDYYTNATTSSNDKPRVPKVQHKDYAEWLNSQFVSNALHEEEAYWTKQLSGEVPRLQLPFSTLGKSPVENTAKLMRFEIPNASSERLERLSGEQNTTLFVSFLAVIYTILYKYTGQTDLTVGVTLADRDIDDIKHQIGCFIHTIPLRIRFEETDSFEQLIATIKTELLTAYQHKRYPIEEAINQPKSSGGYDPSPLYNVLVVMQNKNESDLLTTLGRETTAVPIEIDSSGSLIDLQLEIIQSQTGFSLVTKYNSIAFEEVQIAGMMSHFIRLIEDIGSTSKKQMQRLTILPTHEAKLQHKFSSTGSRRSTQKTIVDLFEQQVKASPTKNALVFGDTSISYQILNQRANKLAHYLIEEALIKPGDHVALVARRSHLTIISILGILKAGCSYTPIDTEQPGERMTHMIEDSGARLMLTATGEYEPLLVSKRSVAVVDIKSAALEGFSDANPEKAQYNQLAYIMYTSGTTGKPKGVMVDHESLTDYVQTFIEYFRLASNDRVVQQSSLSFDTYVEEVYPTLAVGGEIVVVEEGGKNIRRLIETIEEKEVTLLSTTPSVIRELNSAEASLSNLRVIISGGDTLRPNDIDSLFGRAELYNTYGPTEATVCASYHHIQDIRNAGNIGQPITNKQIYILDKRMEPVPIGITGELYIGGAGLARGYVNREATPDGFVEVPFLNNRRMYQTGDTGRWTHEGTIELLGRNDNQININGYRVETVEVENAILAHPTVDNVAVLADNGDLGNFYLLALYTGKQEIDNYLIREFLADKLPLYMIPSYFIYNESIPLTLTGKTDYQELRSSLSTYVSDKSVVAPLSETEKKLACLYERVLEKNAVNGEDNFFALGGNSIKAVSLTSSIHKTFGVKLNVRHVFLHPNIRSLASKIQQSSRSEAYEPIEPSPEEAYYPLSNAQKRLWVLHQLEQHLTAYNITLARELQGQLDLEVLEKAVLKIAERHDILRTTFIVVSGEPKQITHNVENFSYKPEVRDVSGATDSTSAIQEAIASLSKEPFDFAVGPLWRVVLFKISSSQWVFFLSIHHIISDGWSINVFAHELSRFYNHYKTGKGDLPLSPTIQYKDYVHWQRQSLDIERMSECHLPYWKEKLYQSSNISFPTDYVRPAFKTYVGDVMTFALDADTCRQLQSLNKRHGVTTFMTLLTCLKALFYRYTGAEDLMVGTATAGRTHASLEGQMGFYLNLLALRTKFSGRESFGKLLESVKKTTLEAYEHQNYPFDLLVEELDIDRDMSRSVLFDIMVGYQSVEMAENKLNEIDGITTTPFAVSKSISQFDLSIDFFERAENKIDGIVEFNTDLFTASRIEALISHFQNIVKEILSDQDIPLCDIDYLSQYELDWLLRKPTKSLGSSTFSSIQEQFEYQASVNKDGVAVTNGNRILTYYELNVKANQVAHYLTEAHNVSPGDLVGLMLERSELAVVAILGVLKSGAAFVPIDPEYPLDRVGHILIDSKVNVLITDQVDVDLPFDNISTVLVDEVLQALDNYGLENLHKNRQQDMAYVIYTSGTTGRPKGVMVEHGNVLSIADSWRTSYALDTFPVRLLQMASISFDVFCGDLCRSLLQGGQMIICPSIVRTDPADLYATMKLHQVNIVESTPSIILPLMNHVFKHHLDISFLKVLIIGSDICLMEDFKLLHTRFGDQCRIINSYGATEATIDSSFYEYREEGRALSAITPIGKPFGNTSLFILDDFEKPLPVGVPGELYIGGDGVARGYISDEKLTADKFVHYPLFTDERLYRTGDSAKWLPSGDVAFLGRKDTQVKIRGNRIELGEIENVLLSHDDVDEAIVSVQTYEDGQPFLIAYYTSETALTSDNIRNYLRGFLPDFMTPLYYIQVERFALTPNGKVDRKSLPPVNVEDISKRHLYIAPKNDIEKQLVSIWERVLKKQNIGTSVPFLEIGGHSLKATQVVSLVNKLLGVNVRLRDIFTNTTIQELARFIEQTAPTKQAEAESISLTTCDGLYDLSTAQRGLWYIEQLDASQEAYSMPDAYTLNGKLNRSHFTNAFQTVIDRHESLRTAIVMVEGEPKQQVYDHCEFDVGYTDVRSSESKETVINEQIERMVTQKFDLSKPPLLVSRLLHVERDSFLFIFSIHHMIADGWSADLLVREVTQLYNAYENKQPNPLSPIRFQYKDFVAWQKKKLDHDAMAESRHYWLSKLVGPVPAIKLPLDFPRPSLKTYEGNRIERVLDQSVVSRIATLGAERGASLFMVLLATVKALLYKYCDQHDIIVGTPVAGRDHADFENIVGFFVNTLPIRTNLCGNDSFIQLLNKIKENILEAFEHQLYPIDRIVEEARIQKDLSRSPLFDVMVVLQNTNLQGDSLDNLQGIEVEACRPHNGASKFDLTFTFTETPSETTLEVEFNTRLFSQHTIRNIVDSYEQIIRSVSSDTNVELRNLNCLSEGYRHRLLHEFNNTTGYCPDNISISQLFERQVNKTPHQIAIVDGNSTLTYYELNQRANKLAHYLRNNFNIQPDDLVGLLLDKSGLLIIGILGVLKSGGAYLPIDIHSPSERIDYIIEDSKIEALLVQPGLSDSVVFEHLIDIECAELAVQPNENLDISVSSNNLLYALYTSGTTGKPKGVLIEHLSIINLTTWLIELMYCNSAEPMTAMLSASINFDASVQQLFAPLLCGSKVVLLPASIKRDPILFVDAIYEHGVEILDITPSYLQILLEEMMTREEKPPLKYTLVGGELLSSKTAKLYLNLFGDTSSLINVYGVTECAVDSTYTKISPTAAPQSIGKPILNTGMYILDRHQDIVPCNVTGELHIGGLGVGRGYLGQLALTEAKYIPNPFVEGDRLYKTGDLAKWTEDGNIIYLGRNDEQVKIRGYRIELQEIERVLNDHDKVSDARVLAVGDSSDDKYLVAFLILKEEVSIEQITAFLTRVLPSYMIPSQFVTTDAFPLTHNGKLDKDSLLSMAPKLSRHVCKPIAPTNETESALITIWEKVFDLKEINVISNFFDLGGSSLKAAQVLFHVHRDLGTKITLGDIFSNPTLQELSNRVLRVKEQNIHSEEIPVIEKSNRYELSHAQKRLWVLNEVMDKSAAYNISSAYYVEGDLDIAALENSLKMLIGRHESLRTKFEVVGGEPQQTVLSENETDFKVEMYDFRKDNLDIDSVKHWIDEESNTPFNLRQDLLFKVVSYRISEDQHILFFKLHHMIADEWSSRILAREIIERYEALVKHEEVNLPGLKLQYRDFSAWQNNSLRDGRLSKERDYWLRQASSGFTSLNFPSDFTRTSSPSYLGETISLQIEDELYAKLTACGRKHNTSLFGVLLTCIKTLLYRYTSSEEITVGMPVSGRNHHDLENQIGFYTNTLAVSTQLTSSSIFSDLLSQVKDNLASALDNQHYPFDCLLQDMNVKWEQGRHPLFDIAVVFQTEQGTFTMDNLKLEAIEIETADAKFDIAIAAIESDNKVTIRCTYRKTLFKRSSIDTFLKRLKTICQEVVSNENVPIADLCFYDDYDDLKEVGESEFLDFSF